MVDLYIILISEYLLLNKIYFLLIIGNFIEGNL